MITRILSVFLMSLVLILSCNTTEPPDPPKPDNRKITLTLEDASCTEAWIQLTTENLQLPAEINILINDSLSHISILSTQDSLLYIDSLLPNKTYNIQTFIHSTTQPELSSNKLTITTLDTTSHNFTWQTFTFGEYGHSVIFDVAVIDENNIYAVGEIYMNDSLGQPDPNAYNAMHWDGNGWSLFGIMFYTICGQQSRTPYPARAIFFFNENEIWIAGGGDNWLKLMDQLKQI